MQGLGEAGTQPKKAGGGREREQTVHDISTHISTIKCAPEYYNLQHYWICPVPV